MFAVIKTGGKQYKVAANDVITIERLEAEAGDVVAFDQVLMLGGDSVTVGTPTVAGATVAAEVVEQARGPKVISFKKRRRQNSKRKKGHRQDLTIVRITEILTGGKKPSGAKAAKPAAVAAAAAGARGGCFGRRCRPVEPLADRRHWPDDREEAARRGHHHLVADCGLDGSRCCQVGRGTRPAWPRDPRGVGGAGEGTSRRQAAAREGRPG